MGSCCATVKINPHFKNAGQHTKNLADVSSPGMKVPKPEEQETLPLSRIVIRGAESAEKEGSGQEKAVFLSGTSNKDYFLPYGITYSCKKGIKSSPSNQDDFIIIQESNVLLFGVFDGHGVFGNDISHYLHIVLPNMILSHPKFPQEIELILTETFFNCNIFLHQYFEDSSKSTELSGSTCTLLILKDHTLYTCNIGDSRAIIAQENKVTKTSVDHKPTIPTEYQRIIKSGGEIRASSSEICSRIFAKGQNLPGICVSRAFGDSLAQSIGVCVDPEISKKKIDEEDLFAIVASDGVWEFMTDIQVSEIAKSSKNPAKNIAEASWSKWRDNEADAVDDITVVVVNIKEYYKQMSNQT